MSDFGSQIGAWVLKTERVTQAVFVNVASRVKSSITDGDPLTGAPGSPVDTGALKASWQLTFESPTLALVSTNIEYAPIIEDNVRGANFRVGGPHGVKLTALGFDRIVEDEARKATGAT